MDQSFHPSIETIADLQEGILPPGLATDTAAHVAECAECAAVQGSLDNVSTVLADDGRAGWPIPAEVARRLDTALRDAERDVGAVPAELRPAAAARHLSHRPSRVLIAAAATAAVVVASGGVWLGLHTGGDNGSDQSATPAKRAANGANGQAGQARKPAPAGKPLALAPRIGSQPAKLQALASGLADRQARPVPIAGHCQTPTAAAGSVLSLLNWGDGVAVLVVGHHIATIHACNTPGVVLRTIHF
ncbi:MAG: hypothetical protein ACR2KG_12235 [Nocardioidaceae bacterium]